MKPFNQEAAKRGDAVEYCAHELVTDWAEVRYVGLSRDLHPVIQLAGGTIVEARCENLRMKPKYREMWVQVCSTPGGGFVSEIADSRNSVIGRVEDYYKPLGEPHKIMVEIE